MGRRKEIAGRGEDRIGKRALIIRKNRDEEMSSSNNPLRHIQSFVRRQGRISQRQQRALDNLWQKYVLALNSEPINWQQLFGREAPHIIEIGFGMGHSLLEMAKANPEEDFIGIEVYQAGIGSLLADLEDHAISNVRIVCADVVEVFAQLIADASLDRVQLFFPDPWPKKRHHKRRLVQDAFVDKLAAKLRPAGVFHIASDWQEYADSILMVVERSPHFINQAGAGQFALRPAYRPLTKYEQRGQALGHGVWDLLFIKK